VIVISTGYLPPPPVAARPKAAVPPAPKALPKCGDGVKQPCTKRGKK